ncbi:MAG: hypothetical protein QOJ93_669, partial [Actinomycetota bacterium]|nr:hypothetical protein [Actinomycetota bacterium]
ARVRSAHASPLGASHAKTYAEAALPAAVTSALTQHRNLALRTGYPSMKLRQLCRPFGSEPVRFGGCVCPHERLRGLLGLSLGLRACADECLDAVEDPFKAEGELVVGRVGVVEDAGVEDRMQRGEAVGVGKPPKRVAVAAHRVVRGDGRVDAVSGTPRAGSGTASAGSGTASGEFGP